MANVSSRMTLRLPDEIRRGAEGKSGSGKVSERTAPESDRLASRVMTCSAIVRLEG